MSEPAFQIQIDNTGERFACAAGVDVLRGMESLGRRGIPVGCRGGGCGVCKVRVLDGPYRTAKMSRACVSEQEQAQDFALACRLYAAGDLRLQVVGKMARALGAPRTGAELDPDRGPNAVLDFAGALAAALGRAGPEGR